jgi:G3E family GTPase
VSTTPPKPPLILLTGFLGAGKTTTLNRVLGAQHRRRVGVIINELGRIDIDTRLVKSRSGDVLELAGGCVCHEVRVQSELWAAIDEVARRSQPEIVVLETTGIAEPWSILDGLEALGPQKAPAIAAGVVCVVDAEAGNGQLARHEEARAQVEAADRILLSKLDLAESAAVVSLHRELAQRNPAAERASFPLTEAGTAELVPWLLDARTHARAARHGHGSHTHGQLTAVAFSALDRRWCARRGSFTWPARPGAGSSSGRGSARSSGLPSPGATSRRVPSWSSSARAWTPARCTGSSGPVGRRPESPTEGQ